MTFHETLMADYPIRRSKEQKERFRAWAVQQAQEAGWEAQVEETSRGHHKNVVIGDPEHAGVVFTAHYDTPAVMVVPNLMLPRNIPLFLLYTIGVVGLIFLIASLAGGVVLKITGNEFAGELVFMVIYLGILFLMLFGPSNKHNANDNTSGVAAVLSLMAAIPEAHRSKAAFILFDNEEKGLLGSSGYAKDHVQLKFMRLLINLDCVGVGEHILLISKKMARNCTGYHLMERCLTETEGRTAHFYDSKTSVGSSDHKNFKCGVVVFACRRKPLVGFYTPYIHTKHDTVCDQSNIDYLTTAFSTFVTELGVKA